MRKLACVTLIVLSALPVLRDDYLFSDDYYWYEIAHSRPLTATREATMMDIMNGRPVHLLGFLGINAVIASRASFMLLRLAGVLLIIATAWATARVLRRRWPEASADWAATLLVALPGFVLYVFWLIGIPCLLGAVLGVLALERALDKRRWQALVLLVLGLATYQPHALLYFALLAFWIASEDNRESLSPTGSLARRQHVELLLLGVAGIAIYYLAARALVLAFGFDMPGRGELVFQPLEKLHWLLLRATPFSAKLWSLMAPQWLGVALLGAVLVWQRPRDWRRGLLIAAACTLTVFPHLAVRETVVRWRVLLPLSFAFAAMGVTVLPRQLLPLFAVLLTGWRTLEVARYGVGPERAILLATAAGIAGKTSVSIVSPDDNGAACVPRVSNDEFTAPSSQRDFAVAGLVRLAAELTQQPPPRVEAGENTLDLRQIAPAFCQAAGAQFP